MRESRLAYASVALRHAVGSAIGVSFMRFAIRSKTAPLARGRDVGGNVDAVGCAHAGQGVVSSQDAESSRCCIAGHGIPACAGMTDSHADRAHARSGSIGHLIALIFW